MAAAHQFVLLFGGIFTLLGVVFTGIGYFRKRMTRGWVATTGQIINPRGDPLSYSLSPFPTFRWMDAQGVEHRHTSWSRSSFGPRPGTLLEVRYDPERPWRGVINSFVQGGQIFTVIGVMLASVGILGMAGAWWLLASIPPL